VEIRPVVRPTGLVTRAAEKFTAFLARRPEECPIARGRRYQGAMRMAAKKTAKKKSTKKAAAKKGKK
jgi:hypothetical protein